MKYRMSVLEIYINWVNSVLGEAGSHVDGVEAVQDGKVLCELIDVLAPDSGLQAKVKASGECTPSAYINTALEHMKNHGIKIKFPAQDIVHNEIKSMLDVLWLLILNYGVHYIGQNAFQRSVGIGKKNLLEWCQEELGATFDSRNTLSYNLCNNGWFIKLLEKMAGCSMQKSKDKAEYIDALLLEIQDRYLIKKDIIKAHDIVDGTVDEHTLMIYLSLLKRRMSYSDRHPRREMLSTDGKAAAMAKIHFFEQRVKSLTTNTSSPRSKSFDSAMERPSKPQGNNGRSSSANSDLGNRMRSKSLLEQTITDGNDTSDWSSTGSLFSGKEKASPSRDISPPQTKAATEILHQTISERVIEHLPSASESDIEARKEAESQRISEKETDTLSEFSSGSLIRERPPLRRGSPEVWQNGSSSRDDSLETETRGQQNIEDMWRHKRAVAKEKHAKERSPSRNHLSRDLDHLSTLDQARDERRLNEGRLSPSIGNRDIIQSHSHSERRLNEDRLSPGISSRESPVDHSHPERRLNEDRLSPGIGSRESFRHSDEEKRLDRRADERVRIKIKRPKDYILQWEDTIDRLSGVSVSEEPSPRTPLISKYRVDVSSRSKSFEPKSAQRKQNDTYSIRSRSSDLTLRNEQSSRVQPHSISSEYTAVNTRSYHPTGQRISPADETGLEAALERLPKHMKQRAVEASKFLMHNSGPEVLALIDAIKQAQEDTNATAPKEVRSLRSESSPSGSRVRFQTSPRPTSHDTSFSSSRGHSLSPGRQQMLSEGPDAAFSSSSPRNRSRSLSPKNSTSHEISDDIMRSPRVRNYSDGGSGMRSFREEVLLKNLGFNSRVVEDERPSSRLKALASSPRSPGAMSHSSPRKIPSVQKSYPEVTRLDLALDSDRSYVSQADDLADDATPRRGGCGRIPRREAWERQRRKRDEAAVTSEEDSHAESKFIDVLVKEINLLKQKVEMIEEDTVVKSTEPVRAHSISRNTRTGSPSLRSELVDDSNELILAPRPSQSISGSRERPSSCPLLETSSRSPQLNMVALRDNTPLKQSVSPHRRTNMSNDINRNRVRSTSNGSSVPLPQGISLGYSGPTRSITPEIWGYDLNSPDGLDTQRQIHWKHLISSRDLTEAEVIELKQALACAIVENDILQAKLNNAKHEIHDKLRHTNEVLEDCRHHLAKSQAENMEHRTKAEQERQRADRYEERIKDLETSVFEAQQNKKHLEDELDQTAILLDKSLIQTKPGVEALKLENSRLVTRLAKAETDNEHLDDEVRRLKRNQAKSISTMDELRECLRKVRRERQELVDEVEALHAHQQSVKVKEIIRSYQEKGKLDESQWEDEPKSRSYFPTTEHQDSDEGIFSGSQASLDQHYRPNLYSAIDDTPPARPEKASKALDISFSSSPSNTPRTSQHRYRNSDSLSPASREIYPHRKSYQPRSRSCSPLTSMHQMSSASPRNYLVNLDDSFVDQTLQEIEQDMVRERQRIFRNPSPARSHLSSYLSEENLADVTRNSKSPGKVQGYESDRGFYSNDQRSQRTDLHNRQRPYSLRNLSSDRLLRSNSPSQNLPKRSSSIADSPRSGYFRGGERFNSRSRSPSCNRSSYRDNSADTNRNKNTSVNLSGIRTPERSQSPVYFPRQCHSPPTRLSPDNKEKTNPLSKKKPRHPKSQPGEIARNLQAEFEKEDKLIQSLSKSSVFKNKSWFEVQSESDGEDTGINSSISSHQGSELSCSGRKRMPMLTDEQRRYADELIQKYTGNTPS